MECASHALNLNGLKGSNTETPKYLGTVEAQKRQGRGSDAENSDDFLGETPQKAKGAPRAELPYQAMG